MKKKISIFKIFFAGFFIPLLLLIWIFSSWPRIGNVPPEVEINQDFSRGVLAINANKSIYAPGEKGNLALAVLDENGNMVCDASLKLKIKNEELGIEDELSTENGKIKVNEETCRLKDLTLEPDYAAEYQWGAEGVYDFNLIAETQNGALEISDRVEVKKKVPFDVERITATRIFPSKKIPVALKITANQDFRGEIVETVPTSFEIFLPAGEAGNPKSEIRNKFETQNSNDQNGAEIKQLIWKVDIKKGDKIELAYQFDAPDVSPEFYLLGPLKFAAKSKLPFLDNKIVFEETRNWQIAADAVSFIGSISAQAANGADVTLTLSGLTLMEGDLVIVSYSIGDNDNTDFNMATVSSGWTEVADLFSDDTYEANLGVYYKFMGSTPDTSVVVDGLGGTDSGTAGVAMAFRGVDTTTPMDVTATTATGINTMHPNPPSIDHNNPSGVWTVIAGANAHVLGATGTYTFPTGYTADGNYLGSNDTSDTTVGMGYRSSGVLDPEDPDTMTHSGTDSTNAAWAAVTMALRPVPEVPGIAGSLGKSSDGWAGAVPVYGTLTGGLSQVDYPYARAYVTTIDSQTFYADMTWDSGDSRFEGTIYIGSNICMGCDDPKTYNGSFSVTVQLDNDAGFGSIDYSNNAGTFTTAMTVKRTSMNAPAFPDTSQNYTDFNSVWSTDHWYTTINDFGFGMKSGTGTNVAVAIPIHPVTSSPTNFAISVNGTSVSPGSAQSTGVNAWWWESSSHTLYIQFASLAAMPVSATSVSPVDVDISFDTDTDLFATRYNWTQSSDMGQRFGSNGLYIANRYLSAFIYPKPTSVADNNLTCSTYECEQSGMQAESRAHEDGGPDESTDCMERVAVHVDGTPRSDGSAGYQYDIKWKDSEYANLITAEDNDHLVIENNSDDTASTGWAQQLNNGIAAERIQTYYAGKRYIKNVYNFTNNDTSSHSYPFVWEREQWHGTDRATNDHGRFQGDTSDRVMEERIALSGFNCPWQTAYDSGTYINMGVIYDKNNLPDYGIFAVEPFLAPTTAQWPITITDVHATQTNDQTGFEKTWSSVAASQTVSFTFWHVHNAESSWANIETAMDADCSEINPPIISLTISDGVVNYGNVLVGTPKDTTGVGGDSQTITNNGNVLEDFEIVGQNSTDWTLGSSAGDAIYKHAFCTSSCDSSPTWTALTTGYQTLATGIAVSGTSVFDLQISVPASNAGTNQQDVHVTVRAVEN